MECVLKYKGRRGKGEKAVNEKNKGAGDEYRGERKNNERRWMQETKQRLKIGMKRNKKKGQRKRKKEVRRNKREEG